MVILCMTKNWSSRVWSQNSVEASKKLMNLYSLLGKRMVNIRTNSKNTYFIWKEMSNMEYANIEHQQILKQKWYQT